MGQIKSRLIDKYERWAAQHVEEAAEVAAGTAPPLADPPPVRSIELRRDQDVRGEEQRRQEQDARSRRAEEEKRYAEARKRADRREQEQRSSSLRIPRDDEVGRLRDAMVSVRIAAEGTASGAHTPRKFGSGDDVRLNVMPPQEARRQQENLKRREEEKKIEEKRKQEQEGIMWRQHEADAAARAARYQSLPLQQLPASTDVKPSTASFEPSPRTLPLESPADDVSDGELFKPARYIRSIVENSHRKYVISIHIRVPFSFFLQCIPSPNHDHFAATLTRTYSLSRSYDSTPENARLCTFSRVDVQRWHEST